MDILLIETGSGGDAVLRGNDLVTVEGLENQPYLAMFGDDGSWWGNIFLQDKPDAQLLSLTEAALNKYALTSGGRLKIEEAINLDLEFLKDAIPGTEIHIQTQIAGANRLDIRIDIDGQTFGMQWNPDSGFLSYSL